MNKNHQFEMQANLEKCRKEMAEIVEISFLNSNNIHEFVREADERIRQKFSMPYSLSLETLYYSLRTIWELSAVTQDRLDNGEGLDVARESAE